ARAARGARHPGGGRRLRSGDDDRRHARCRGERHADRHRRLHRQRSAAGSDADRARGTRLCRVRPSFPRRRSSTVAEPSARHTAAAAGPAPRRRQRRRAGLAAAAGGLRLSQRDGLLRGSRRERRGGAVNERSLLRRECDRLLLSLQFFTRIPIPARVPYSEDELNQAAIYFPLIGTLIGALCALAYWGASFLWPVPVAILLS